MEGVIHNMSVKRRKDSKNRVLKEGEYQRSNGTYEYKWRDNRGNRHSISSVTLENLREKELVVLRDTLNGVDLDSRKITVDDLYVKWVHIKRGIKRNTLSSYMYFYSMYVKSELGQRKISTLKRSDIKAFCNDLLEIRHLKLKSVSMIVQLVRQILNVAVDDDYLQYNPADNALRDFRHLTNNLSEPRRALTRDEQRLFEVFLAKPGIYHHWYPIFTVLLWTGMRVGEVLGLRWCDIDFEKNTINVDHTLMLYPKYDKNTNHVYSTLIVNTTKTKAGNRIVPMIAKVKAAFLEEQLFQKELGIKSRSNIDGYSDFVFVKHNRNAGKVLYPILLNNALKRIILACNKLQHSTLVLPYFTCHHLRHTFATRMCESGMNVKAIQSILGHANYNITMDVYTDVTEDFKKSQMLNFEKEYHKITSVNCNDCDCFATDSIKKR